MEMENDKTSAFYYKWHEPFADYQVTAEQPGPAFYIFVSVYTLLVFLFIAPLVSWSRNQEEKKLEILESDEKQVEQRKEPEPRRVSENDDKQPSWKEDLSSFPSDEEGDGNVTKKNNSKQETNSHGGSVRDINKNKQLSKSLSGSRSSQISSNDDIDDRRSSSSIGADKKEISKTSTSSGRSRMSKSLRSVLRRQFDQSYPDQDPDFQNHISHRFPEQSFPHAIQNENNNNPQQDQQRILQQLAMNKNCNGSHSGNGSKQPTEISTSTPSAATTSKVHRNRVPSTVTDNNHTDKGFSKRVLDVGGRRWKNRRPIGRVDVIKRQSSSVAGSKTIRGGSIARPSQRRISIVSSTNSNTLTKGQQRLSKSMSEVASTILSEQHHQLNHQPQIQFDISLMKNRQLERLQLQQQHQLRQQQQERVLARHWLQQQRRHYSRRSSQNSSVMSSIVDDISPDDAPDANDPGRGNVFIEPDEKYWIAESQYDYQSGTEFGNVQAGCCSSPLESLLSLAAPDFDKWNVVKASIPLTLGASSEALFRLITIAFISQKLGTKSMIAFLLVGLFVRLTSEELAGAIIDALSSFVQPSIDRASVDVKERNYIAGQYIQLGLILQLVLNIPLLVLWGIFMQRFVMWLVDDPEIAKLAGSYAGIAVGAYMVQALSRTLTFVFHICGHEHFESVIDLVAAAAQVIAIGCVLVLVDEANLNTVAYIQVLITASSAILKITYPEARGWMRPFRKGLIQDVALRNYKFGIWHLLKAVGPLLLGSVLEYGEWEILTLFIRSLGPAEVATWALLGAFWDFFEALTEGIAEAAANNVSYLLSAGQVDRAKKLCYGVIYMAVIQSIMVTSALYMSGQYLVVLFTTDPAIQHTMNNTIVMIGFANVIMAYSRITWSLVGSQGRFRLATFVVFFSRWLVTMPFALICIYGLVLDLNAVCGSLVVGYATACCALTIIVLTSDWHRLARLMQVMNQTPLVYSAVPKVENEDVGMDGDGNADDPILGLVNLDDFDDSDDDSDGFGFGEYGDAVDDGNDPNESSVSRKESSRRAVGAQPVPQTKYSERRSQSL